MQAKIVRPILYLVTTNGWLGQKIGKFLQEMHLDSAVLKNQSTWIKNDISRPPMISTRSIGEVSQEDFAQFTLKTYYYRFTEHQDKFDVKQFLETVPRYFSENIFGRGYYKDGEMVGVIISHHYGQHPAINQSTLHIGYWGYDRSSVTPEEARWIKEDWFTSG